MLSPTPYAVDRATAATNRWPPLSRHHRSYATDLVSIALDLYIFVKLVSLVCYSIYTVPGQPDNELDREQVLTRLDFLKTADKSRLNEIAATARVELGTEMGAVSIVHQDSTFLLAAAGFAPGVYRRSTSLCGYTILTPHQTFVIPDTLADERFAGNPYVATAGGIRFYAAAPIVHDGAVAVGAVCVFDTKPRTIVSTAHRQILIRLAEAAMGCLSTHLDTSAAPRID